VAGYEIVEHTADVGVRAYGATLAEAFAAAAEGMFSLMVELATVEPRLERRVALAEDGYPALLVGWLNELLYLHEVEGLVFCRFEVSRLTPTELQGAAWGELLDPARHQVGVAVKAATYHRLVVEEGANGARVQVILDL